MRQVTMKDAEAHLGALIQEVIDGETIVISRGDVPVAKLVPVEAEPPRRRVGFAAGKFRMTEDFDEPLEDFAGYR